MHSVFIYAVAEYPSSNIIFYSSPSALRPLTPLSLRSQLGFQQLKTFVVEAVITTCVLCNSVEMLSICALSRILSVLRKSRFVKLIRHVFPVILDLESTYAYLNNKFANGDFNGTTGRA